MIKVQHIILLGAPGVGKGTLASLLAQRENFTHLSTGEIFRAEIAAATPLGQKVAHILASGAYVPDEVTNAVVAQQIKLAPPGTKFIFDGYPRTREQASFLATQVTIARVILLTAHVEELTRRLLARGRLDDTVSTIKRRIEVYEAATLPLVQFYAAQHKLQRLASDETIEANYASLVALLNKPMTRGGN